MKITIHRGINQIGGCITEIATDSTKILIDLGENLPDGEGVVTDDLANSEAIEKLTASVNAILFTHYHGDHIGLFPLVKHPIPQYIGAVAKKVILCKHQRLGFIKGREKQTEEEIKIIERINSFTAENIIQIGDIKIIPYFVSHSAYDSYMFLIEADGRRILHTGDFRGHGYLSKGLIPTIEKLILKRGNIDVLITEGTMLSRMDEKVRPENKLKYDVISLMKQYKNIFVMCSSTDLERLATIYAANKAMRNRAFICDDYQKNILEIFSETAGQKSPLFNFEKPYTFNEKNTKLIKWMKDTGFCMLVRASDKFNAYIDFLLPLLEKEETIVIYSMWKEYINPTSKYAIKNYMDFIDKFPNMNIKHTSGHASADCLAAVCNLVNPQLGIIPIHSEHSSDYQNLEINDLKNKVITESTEVENINIIIK